MIDAGSGYEGVGACIGNGADEGKGPYKCLSVSAFEESAMRYNSLTSLRRSPEFAKCKVTAVRLCRARVVVKGGGQIAHEL